MKNDIASNAHFKIWIWSALVFGSILRFLWPGDMHWNRDQTHFVQFIQNALQNQTWPWLGLPSSAGIKTPGASMWVMIAFSKISSDPVFVMFCLQLTAVLTLWLFYLFIVKKIPADEKQLWFWGLILFCVNPLALFYSRMFWPPTVLFLVCFGIFFGHWHRQKHWGALLWGFGGSIASQIQMGGFWFVLAILISTYMHHRNSGDLKVVRWKTWFIGSALGAIPLFFWFSDMLNTLGGQGKTIAWVNILTPKFWTYWLVESTGLYIQTALKPNFWGFLQAPHIAGNATYFLLGIHIFIAGIAFWAVFQWIKNFRKPTSTPFASEYVWIAVCYGLTMQLTGLGQHPHYLQYTYPFLFLWLAKNLIAWPKILKCMVLLQFIVSLSYLTYVHQHQGVPGGFFKHTYKNKARNFY